MAKGAGKKTPTESGVTAAGIVEAIEQDVELSLEQAKDIAHDAVAAVEEKLGVGKSRARKPPMKVKTVTLPAKKPTARKLPSAKPPKAKKRK